VGSIRVRPFLRNDPNCVSISEQWTTTGKGPRFAMIIRHDDPEREFAYDRDSHIGKLDKGLDEAPKRGWTIVSMKDEWNTVYPE